MALTLLRTAITQQQHHSYTDDLQHILLHDKRIPKSTTTSYKTQKLDAYYDINAIYYLYNNSKLKYSEYIASCTTQSIQPVDLPQQRFLLQFLRGERDETPYYDKLLEEKLLHDLASITTTANPTALSTELTIDAVLADEVELTSRQAMMQCERSVRHVIQMYQSALKQKSRSSSGAHATAGSAANKKPRTELVKQPSSFIPIIIVPAAVSSVITMYNALNFLQNGVFQPSSDCKRENPVKPALITINKTSYQDRAKSVQYHVIDDIAQLKTAADWQRVCAVFVHGATWQFTGWPKEWPTPASIFENVCAFHLHFDDEPLHPNVKVWKLNRLQVSKTKRYQDRSVALEFWDKLGQFLIPINAKKQLKI